MAVRKEGASAMTDKKDEALKLALEALEASLSAGTEEEDFAALDLMLNARKTIKSALAESALERMAENERELGLDYMDLQDKDPELIEQPAQQQDHDCALKRGGIVCRHCDLEIVEASDAPQIARQQDIPDLIAGALGVSRGTAYDMMREVLAGTQQHPDLSHLRPETQEAIRGWIKDGTFFDRAIGTMHDQEKRLMAYEKAQQEEPCGWRMKHNGEWAYSFTEDAWDFIRRVPKAQQQEPTKAMIDAAERIDWSDADVRGNIVNMWQAMCAAAPQPAQQQEPVAWPHKWGCRANAFGECNMGCTSPQPAQQEPVAFLANGTRFKMSFFENEDGPGTNVTCFEAFEKELDGRWVALVAAEDDCHLKLTSPPASKPLTERQISKLWSDAHNDTTDRMAFQVFARLVEAAHNIGDGA